MGPRVLGPLCHEILERAIAVPFEFSASSPQLSLDDLAVQSGIDETSLVRSLRTLEPAGFVLREAERDRLGPRLLELANVYLSTLSFHEVAQQRMVTPAQSSRQTLSPAILDGLDVVDVAIEDVAVVPEGTEERLGLALAGRRVAASLRTRAAATTCSSSSPRTSAPARVRLSGAGASAARRGGHPRGRGAALAHELGQADR